jgi:hypothetical protein
MPQVGIKVPVLTDALLSTFDLAHGVVYAGYLERKSGLGLIWKKNYAVLICINDDAVEKCDDNDVNNNPDVDTGNKDKNIGENDDNDIIEKKKNGRKSFLLYFYSKHVSTAYGDVGVGAEVGKDACICV